MYISGFLLLLHRGHLESQEMTEICLSVDDVGDNQEGMGTGKMSDLDRGRRKNCSHNGPTMTHSNGNTECLSCNEIIGKRRE